MGSTTTVGNEETIGRGPGGGIEFAASRPGYVYKPVPPGHPKRSRTPRNASLEIMNAMR